MNENLVDPILRHPYGHFSPAPTTVLPLTFTPDPNCQCGCISKEPNGKIVSLPKCRGSSQWTLIAPEGHVIKLTFDWFHLNPEDRTSWLTVRDGDAPYSDLLEQNFGDDPPASVVSTQRVMQVELMTPLEPGFGGSQPEGFAASYTSMGK